MTLVITVYETAGRGQFHASASGTGAPSTETATGSRATVEKAAEKWIRDYLNVRASE